MRKQEIHTAPTGWIVTTHSDIARDQTGLRVLVAYTDSGYGPSTRLDSAHNESATVADHIVRLALEGAGRTLSRGTTVQ